MTNPLVSIIVPIFNAETYIEKCIACLVHQSYKNIQIILVNDGSTDNTRTICEHYALKDPRITIVDKKNGGVSSARNAGLILTKGEYIMFVDSDDWIEVETIGTLVNCLKDNQYDILMYGIYRENNSFNQKSSHNLVTEKYIGKKDIAKILPKLIQEEKINSVFNKIYKRDLIEKNKVYFDESLSIGEDALFNYQLFFYANSFGNLNLKLYHYMTTNNDQSLSKRYNPKKYEELVYVNDYLQMAVKNHVIFSNSYKAAQYIRVKNIYSCFLDIFNPLCPLTIKEKKDFIRSIILKEKKNYHHHNGDNRFKVLLIVLYTKNINLIYLLCHALFRIKKSEFL